MAAAKNLVLNSNVRWKVTTRLQKSFFLTESYFWFVLYLLFKEIKLEELLYDKNTRLYNGDACSTASASLRIKKYNKPKQSQLFSDSNLTKNCVFAWLKPILHPDLNNRIFRRGGKLVTFGETKNIWFRKTILLFTPKNPFRENFDIVSRLKRFSSRQLNFNSRMSESSKTWRRLDKNLMTFELVKWLLACVTFIHLSLKRTTCGLNWKFVVLGSTVVACNDRSWWLFCGQQSWDEMAQDSIPAPDKLLARKFAHEKFLCAFQKRTYDL